MSINRRIEKLESRQPRESLQGAQPLVVKLTDDFCYWWLNKRFTDEKPPQVFDNEGNPVPEDYGGPLKWDMSGTSEKALRELEKALQAEEGQKVGTDR